jgi:hypothetical protein
MKKRLLSLFVATIVLTSLLAPRIASATDCIEWGVPGTNVKIRWCPEYRPMIP